MSVKVSARRVVLAVVLISSYVAMMFYAQMHDWDSRFAENLTIIGASLWFTTSIVNMLNHADPETLFSADWCKLIWLFAFASASFSLQIILQGIFRIIVFGVFVIVAGIVLVPVYVNIIKSIKSRRRYR